MLFLFFFLNKYNCLVLKEFIIYIMKFVLILLFERSRRIRFYKRREINTVLRVLLSNSQILGWLQQSKIIFLISLDIDDPTYFVQSISWIWASYISWRWFVFRLKPIFNIAPAASKNTAQFKSGHNWLKNNHLHLFIYILDALCIC